MWVFWPVCNQILTFDPDVAVPLEVVVGSFPGVAVVPQKGDRRPRLDWHITHTFFIYNKNKSLTICGATNTDWNHEWMVSHYIPTYSLGGDSHLSALPVIGLPGVFSSSVLLVSTISLSSVEITCCCLRGFFLGDAPGIRSPVAGVVREEAWLVRACIELGSVREEMQTSLT